MKPRASNFSKWMAGHWLGGGIITALTAVFGLVLFLCSIGGDATRLSYDLPFVMRASIRTDEAVIVYLDEMSHSELNQPLTAPWDRALHARLIDRLMADGAKAVVFDILFTSASGDATADERLARAIRESGRVILAGNFNQRETEPGIVARWEEFPFEPFARAAAGWGNVNLLPDPDLGVRCHFPNLDQVFSHTNIDWLPWAAARFAGAEVTRLYPPPAQTRWLNYYGPPGALPSVSYFKVLAPDGVPPDLFKNKVVFVGARLSADFSGKGKDEFATPYTRWGRGSAPGVEIHATAFLNLLRGDWLTRLSVGSEVALVLLVAVLNGFVIIRWRPLAATAAALGGMLLIAIAAHAAAWYEYVWFAWVVLLLQLALGLFCSVVYNSLRLYIEKRLLEQSLAAHLSPAVVKRVLKDPSLRRQGGVKQEVSLLFSDIASFSRVSEILHPDDLLDLLNRYFEAALKCIHETDGTVMDLVGDAIFAVWNAPIEQPDHRERACRAAMMLRDQLVEFNASQRTFPLRTRVGLHTGIVCIGNIGSAQRFDYAAVGESTNLASRLEGLNKLLGTDVLATRQIQKAVEGKFASRRVGFFRFKGFERTAEVHELFGPSEAADGSAAWREAFAQGLACFCRRDFDAAEQAFRDTIRLRKTAPTGARAVPARSSIEEANASDQATFVDRPDVLRTGTVRAPGAAPGCAHERADDGPSLFYLDKITELRLAPPPPGWIGEVALKEK